MVLKSRVYDTMFHCNYGSKRTALVKKKFSKLVGILFRVSEVFADIFL